MAILAYCWGSSPTPDGFGIWEILVAGLLLLAVGLPHAAMAICAPQRGALWEKAGWLLLVYGLTVPVIGGMVAGHDPALMMRDIIAFFFMLLPLFVSRPPRIEGRPRLILTAVVAIAGMVFALRLLVPSFIESGRVGFSALPDEDPLYLANAPTVLFMAILGFGLGGMLLMQARGRPRYYSAALGLIVCAMPSILAMAASSQRASFGMAVACLTMLWLVAFIRQPRRALIPLLIALALVIAYRAPLHNLLEHLMEKTAQVGFNNRLQEASVVFNRIGEHWGGLLFGLGWGQTVASPAVGEVTVNYTHTMLTAYWLKSGLAGVVLVGLYLAGLASLLWNVIWRRPILAFALAAPCLIDIALYASYKSLDFGLMLMLIPLWVDKSPKVAPQAGVVYAKDIIMNPVR